MLDHSFRVGFFSSASTSFLCRLTWVSCRKHPDFQCWIFQHRKKLVCVQVGEKMSPGIFCEMNDKMMPAGNLRSFTEKPKLYINPAKIVFFILRSVLGACLTLNPHWFACLWTFFFHSLSSFHTARSIFGLSILFSFWVFLLFLHLFTLNYLWSLV